MSNSVGGAVAEGIRGGWQMGHEADAAAEHRREFDAEQASRESAQARLAKQEDDRYGRMNDQARVQAAEARLATLKKLSDGAIAAGHQPSEAVLQEQAKLMVQLEDMQNQIQTTGRLVAPSAAAVPVQSLPSPQGVVPNAATDTTAPPAAAPSSPVSAMTGTAPAPQPAATPRLGADAGAAPPAAAVSSPVSSAVTPTQKVIADTDQRSQDLASRLSTGQTSLSEVNPGDFALMVASATKRPPGELDQVRQHIADWQSGMATKNDGLTLQGLNGIFGPQINQGVGTPSPHGGTITGKSIIGLDPAMSADGVVHTDKVIPRLQITTSAMGADGQPLSYHAPMTQNRSSDPGDPVTAIPMADAVNHIGALGALVESASHPDAQALLAKGATDPRIAAYLDAIKQGAQPSDPVAQKQAVVDKYAKLWGTDNDATVQRLVQLGYLKPVPPVKGTVAQTMEAAQTLVANGEAPDLQTGLKMLQGVGVTKQPSKYSAGAVAASSGVAGGTGSGAAGGLGTPGATGDDYLKTLSPAMQARVKNIAENPELLKNIPTAKGQRAAMQDAVLQYKPGAALGKDAGGMGAREAVFINRTLTSANEAAKDLENIAMLPMKSSSGFFGGAHAGTTLLSAPMTALGNKMTSQEVQSYNTMATGFHRSLAGIESAGLAPTGQLTNQMDSVIFKEGDTELTKLQKLAQTRQIVEAGLETTLANPKLAPQQRDHVNTIMASVRKAVPYTMQDIIRLQAKWDDDPSATLSSIIAKKVTPAAAPVASPVAGGAPKKLVYNPTTGGFN
jgi:hypothetical protein